LDHCPGDEVWILIAYFKRLEMRLILQNKTILTLLSVCILLTACEKIDVPTPVKEDPVFEVAFGDGTSSFNIGGPNTELVSTVVWDDLNIRIFEGALVNTKDQTSLSFRLRDNRITKANTSGDTISILMPGELQYVNKNQSLDEYKVLVNKLSDLNYHSKSSWLDPFILFPTQGAFFNINNFRTDRFTTFCLTIEDEATNCNTLYCKNYIYNEGDIPLLGFSLNNNIITPIIDPSFTGEILFRWNDEEKDSHEIVQKGKLEFVAIYDKGNNGRDQTIHSVDMYVDTDAQGNAIAPCFTGIESKLVIFDRSPDFSKVEIVWVNENGKEFKSSNTAQTDVAKFEVKEVSHFPIRNQDGHRVLKVDVEFSCTLQSEDGEKIVINNGAGTIGFAYF